MAVTIQEGDQWIYHPEHGARLIWIAEIGDLMSNGWCFTPNDFPKEVTEKQEPEMDKSEVYAYGKELGVALVWRTTKDTMISQIEEHLNGNG
jgi:hypothetical protein